MARQPKCDDQIVEAIESYWQKYFSPPSLEWLVNNTCIASKNTMYFALRRLAKYGYVKLVRGKAVPMHIVEYINSSYMESVSDEPEKSTAIA